MARVEKTVFISYRRKDISWALAVYQYLTNQKYDVFFDYTTIPSGDFEQNIVSNIKARAHFLLILTPTALDRCTEPGDWLKREIELAIDEKRNIVPLFFNGFNFGHPSVAEKLTGKLGSLSHYNGMNVHEDFFEEAMERLRERFLSKPLSTVLHPVPNDVQKMVREEKIAAENELKRIETAKELDRLLRDAVKYEVDRKVWSALQACKRIKEIDPAYPDVDQKIQKLEKELRARCRPILRITGFSILFGSILLASPWFWNTYIAPEPTMTPSSTATRTPSSTTTPSPTFTSTITFTSTPSHTPTITPTPTITLTPTPPPSLSINTANCSRAKFPFGTVCTIKVGISWIPKYKSNKVCVYAATDGRPWFQDSLSYNPNRTAYSIIATIGDEKTPLGKVYTIKAIEGACSGFNEPGPQTASVNVTR